MYLFKKRLSKIISMTMILFLMIGLMTNVPAIAVVPEISAQFNLTNAVSNNNLQLDEEFIVSYKITPEPISFIPEAVKEKEIVLVIDTSGSMDFDLSGKSVGRGESHLKRISIAKAAAKKFLTNLEAESNIKVALVEYSNTASIKQTLTSDFSLVSTQIDGLGSVGGTNIGDGLRRAYYELMGKGSPNAEKYIVFLTDGQPTYHSYENVRVGRRTEQVFYMKSGNPDGFTGGGSSATPKDKDYCYKVIRDLINTTHINSYMVAFTSGSDANIMADLARTANGVYKQALNSEALNDVYNDISDVIASDFAIQDVAFEETFPTGLSIVQAEGLSIDSQKVSGNIGNVLYKLNAAGTHYVANPIEFSIKLKGSVAGTYILARNNSSKISYKDFNGSDKVSYFSENAVGVMAPIPFGTPVIEKDAVRKVGEKYQAKVKVTLPEGTVEARFIRIKNGGVKETIEVFAPTSLDFIYDLPEFSIYEDYTVELDATDDEGVTNTSNSLTVHKKIDIN